MATTLRRAVAWLPGSCGGNRRRLMSPVRYFRWVLWLALFAVATFCWVVLIEHGPENFLEGSKIEIQNLGWFTFRFFK